MSSRSQFRSAEGCCICGTKSSSSRFSNSARFSQHFSRCFGPKGEGRSGDICNACVLYVKRWCKASDQSTGKYEKVLDKKKGPGLKHITQIVKMQQRKQARLKAFGSTVASHGMETRSKNQKQDGFCSSGASGCSSNDASSALSDDHSLHHCHHHHYHHHHHHHASLTDDYSDLLLANGGPMGENNSDAGGSYGNYYSYKDSGHHHMHHHHQHHQQQLPLQSSGIIGNGALSVGLSGVSSNMEVGAGSQTIILGVGPSGTDTSLPAVVMTRASSGGSHDNLDALSQDSAETEVFRVPQPCSRRSGTKSTNLAFSSAAAASNTNYKKRVQMAPVKLPNADEVDSLLREIMQRNSQVVNFEIPLAMQNHLRLRSRTIMQVSSGSSDQSCNDKGSINSCGASSSSSSGICCNYRSGSGSSGSNRANSSNNNDQTSVSSDSIANSLDFLRN